MPRKPTKKKKRKRYIPLEDRPYYHPITGRPLPLVIRPRRYRFEPICPRKPFYSTVEAGIYLGLSTQAVSSRCRTGGIKATRKGNLWKIPYESLRLARDKEEYDSKREKNLPHVRAIESEKVGPEENMPTHLF